MNHLELETQRRRAADPTEGCTAGAEQWRRRVVPGEDKEFSS